MLDLDIFTFVRSTQQLTSHVKIRGQQRIKQISSGCRGTLRKVSSFPYRCSPFLPPVIPIWSVLIQGCFVPRLTQGLRHWPPDVSILDNNPLKLWQAKQRIQPPAAHIPLNNTFSLHPWENPQPLFPESWLSTHPNTLKTF